MNYMNQMPIPPLDMVMPQLYQAIFTYMQIVPLAIVAYLAFNFWKKEKSPLPFYFLIGGGIACFFEPIVDVLGCVWFPKEGTWVVLHAWDRFIPAYMLPVYVFFWGGLALYSYIQMEKGLTTKGLWKLYGLFVIVNLVSEIPGLNMGVYAYYGNQPFRLLKLPLWWPVVNPLAPITAAAMVYKLKPFLTGYKLLLIMAIIPMADGLVNGALAWPVWTALNSGSSLLVTHIAAVITLYFGLIWAWWLSLLVANDSPHECT